MSEVRCRVLCKVSLKLLPITLLIASLFAPRTDRVWSNNSCGTLENLLRMQLLCLAGKGLKQQREHPFRRWRIPSTDDRACVGGSWDGVEQSLSPDIRHLDA